MRKRIIGLGVLSLLVAAAAAPAQEKKKGPAILVLDLERCVSTCEEAKEAVDKLKATSEQKKKEFAEEVAKLEEKKRQIVEKTALSERDAKWYEDLKAVTRQESELRAAGALFNVQIGDAIARKTDQLMKGAREVAERVRKERGAVMVVISKLGPIRFENEKQLQEEQAYRRVFCHDKDADITEEVLAAMNAWYKDNKREDGTVAPREEAPSEGTGKEG